MSHDAAVITAIYDGYDELKPTLSQNGLSVDWVFVTDDPEMIPRGNDLGWRVIFQARPNVHPNRAAKRPKFLPWLYTEANQSVWVDGSFRILSKTFVEEALSFAGPIAQFSHPWRDCLYAETQECIAIPKYEPRILQAQAEHYMSNDHPHHWGLWATGVIARHHTPEVVKLGEHWMGEVDRWSYQDQVSQPYVLRNAGLRPTEFPGSHLANGWVAYEGSLRH